MDLILIIVTMFVVALYYYKQRLYKIYAFLNTFPGPPAIPLFGNIHELTSNSVILKALSKYQCEYGSVYKLYAGLVLPIQFALVVTDLKLLEFVLGSQKAIEKSFTYNFLHTWLGTGLLTSGGKKWKQRRKIITPTFHFQILEQFVDVFNTQGDILVKRLRQTPDTKSLNIYSYVTMCTLDVICESAMGTSVNAQTKPDSDYVRSVKEMCRIIVDRSCSPLKMIDGLYRFSRDFAKEKRAVKILHDYTDSVIRSRSQKLVNNNSPVVHDDDGTERKKRLAFLDLLLNVKNDSGSPLNHEDIREEVYTFMFEGHDTTASAVSFALYCLATNPIVQQNVLEELTSIFGQDTERPATHQDLQEMKYLELVIKESLRLYPSVPIYARCVEEDLKYNDIVLPKGLTILVYAYGLHRDPNIYPEPEKFDPERFLLENAKLRSPYAFIPFSAGPRNCIGQKFAFLEMKATLSKLLRIFELSPSKESFEPALISETILKSSNGIRIGIEKRNLRGN